MKGLNEAGGGSAAPAPAAASQTGESSYSRTNPFRAEVLENLNLNGRGSNKETRHVELSLEGSGLTYEPGDSLGVYPENDPELVELLLKEMNWDPEEIVTLNKQGDVRPLKEALISHYEITVLTKPLLEQAAQLTGNDELRELLAPGNEENVKAYIEGRDLLDLVRDYGPFSVSAQEFVSILRKMPARLYSIASSLSANPDEVHLTIGAVRYDAHGRERKGVCSILCAERLQPGDTLPVYVQHNQNFKLPKDPETPIIMVGPGTGVAPFRSFMQEREETGAEGKAWMFFGDQHFVTDFLYQTEWQNWLKDGVLTKWMWRSHVIRKKKYMCSTACLNIAQNCLNGFKKERLFTFAEMKSTWRMTSITHCLKLSKRRQYEPRRGGGLSCRYAAAKTLSA